MVYNPNPRTRDDETVFVNPQIKALGNEKDYQALAYTIVTTYPFALLVSKLSRIDEATFVPCSQRACTFMKIFGSGMVPSTVNAFNLKHAFDVVVNGNLSQSELSEDFLSPLCPTYSAEHMRHQCDSRWARDRIINPLDKSWCRVIYVWFITLWSVFKVLHDWLLLGGAHEYTTLRIGCASVFFQLMAVSTAFLWSMGAVEVFVAELVPGKCACYYVLPELEAILAIGTPFLLFVNAVKKLEMVHRAPLVGDYLYYQQYEVPFRLALKSGAVDYSTCLVGTACGYHHEEWEERLAISELRCLHTVHSMMCYVLFLGVVSAFVGLAIGPVTARAIELLTQLIGNGMLPLDLLVAVLAIAVWFFPTYLILRLIEALPVNFHDCQTRPELWEYQCPKFNLLIRVAFIVFLAICLFWASLILTSPLAEVLTQRHVTFNSRVALRIAVAGIIYFGFGVQMFVWIVYLIPTHRALFVKARKPYRPSSYIEIGENHPEFNLEKEVQLARVFLKENRNPENLEMVEGWQERWREILDPESEHDDSDEAREALLICSS
ncbi:unnamed protein product [Durusdinium trenchii]|uniref:Uncharacterized protein n=1 Tax=Durusdinium trenchii TaxID=1381693 RepID=A0ABP0P0P3_9DINO